MHWQRSSVATMPTCSLLSMAQANGRNSRSVRCNANHAWLMAIAPSSSLGSPADVARRNVILVFYLIAGGGQILVPLRSQNNEHEFAGGEQGSGRGGRPGACGWRWRGHGRHSRRCRRRRRVGPAMAVLMRQRSFARATRVRRSVMSDSARGHMWCIAREYQSGEERGSRSLRESGEDLRHSRGRPTPSIVLQPGRTVRRVSQEGFGIPGRSESPVGRSLRNASTFGNSVAGNRGEN